MKSKITMVAVAMAAMMLAMPVGAEAGFRKDGWQRWNPELWFRAHCTKKIAKKGKKTYAKKKAMKKAKKS
jgi:hypothetical protein